MTLLHDVKESLVSVSLTHAANMLEQIIEQAYKSEWELLKTMHTLLNEELQGRQNKATDRRLKAAGLPFKKTVDEFDFGFQMKYIYGSPC